MHQLRVMNKIIWSTIIFLMSSCVQSQKKNDFKDQEKFQNAIYSQHWMDGKAEIAVYDLTQNRYNGLHQGNVVSVFVPEDFLTEKQVKNERYVNEKSTKILKNINLRKFTTGIYDYSIFSSVFTPLDRNTYDKSLKVTMSMQEWCGTTFMQLNNKKNAFQLEIRSYFEVEGDETIKLEKAVLEDELLNLIRMNPELLPIGKFGLISSLSYTALKHKKAKVYSAEGTLEMNKDERFEGGNLMAYRLKVEEQDRELIIVFEAESPYIIKGWTEEYPSAFDGRKRQSIAKLKSVQRMRYWELNGIEDTKYREILGL